MLRPSPRALVALAAASVCLAVGLAACRDDAPRTFTLPMAPAPAVPTTTTPPPAPTANKGAGPIVARAGDEGGPGLASVSSSAQGERGGAFGSASGTAGLGIRGVDKGAGKGGDTDDKKIAALFDEATGRSPLEASLGGVAGGGGRGTGGGLGVTSLQGAAMKTSAAYGVGTGTGYGGGAGHLAGAKVAMATRAFSARDDVPPPAPGGTFHHAGVNPIVSVKEDRFSTFGVDVDSGSFLYARRFLRMGRAPDPASVRVEEFVNAMHYDYAGPKDAAFAIHVDAAPSPFTRGMDVVRVALQGKRLTKETRKPATLTFLVDVSGSMDEPDRLPWVREGLRLAVDHLRDDDRVAIVTYAGETRLALPATPASDRAKIHAAIDGLVPGGGTNMGSGMELAYREANKELGDDRISRVIVLSDGDANIGRTSHQSILDAIKGYVSEGVTLSTIGFGSGNYNDVMMEQLADAGNGNYTYIDGKDTLHRFFVDELTPTIEVIAQDAKIQVEWNPDVVESYRLLGYENRDIADRDFRNDKKDAGDIGAGHAVTALYEISLVHPGEPPADKLGTVRIRHKIPRHLHATEVAVDIAASDVAARVDDLDDDAKAALGMALGAEILRGSEHAAGLTLVDAAKLLRAGAHGRYAAERLEVARLFERAPVRAVAVR